MLTIYNEAHYAGMIAGNACKPVPMGVQSSDIMGNRFGAISVVDDGVCGFAWINVSYKTPDNRKFVNALKKAQMIRKSYSGGFDIWVSDFNQSMQRKEAYARAFASVLKAHNIECYVGTRMD